VARAMIAPLMDGNALARRVLADVAVRAAEFSDRVGRRPCLAAFFNSSDPASVKFVSMKRSLSEGAGVHTRPIDATATATTALMVEAVTELSRDPSVDGILVQ
jgi:methylenetetrahydrofolate dehydrogenase (NADP+) / methenyltetrahydrofolate cyclohydrolase